MVRVGSRSSEDSGQRALVLNHQASEVVDAFENHWVGLFQNFSGGEEDSRW